MTNAYDRRFWNRRKRRRRFQKKNFLNEYKDRYHTKRRQINILDNMMGPNAKFYGHFLWKPVNSEKSSPVCRECEEKRSSCFAVSNIFFIIKYSLFIYLYLHMFMNIYICIYIYQYLQYYAATYGICGIVWYVEFITDTDGLVGDYLRPATTLCNLATYPRTFDCVWNTFQNCYRYLIKIAKIMAIQ